MVNICLLGPAEQSPNKKRNSSTPIKSATQTAPTPDSRPVTPAPQSPAPFAPNTPPRLLPPSPTTTELMTAADRRPGSQPGFPLPRAARWRGASAPALRPADPDPPAGARA